MFRVHGFLGSTVEEISERAGFSRGAFYSNFESKEELFVKLLQSRIQDEFGQMLERAPQNESPRQQLMSMVRQNAPRDRRGERWVFELWLECLAQAPRDPNFASLPAAFWRRKRNLVARMIGGAYAEAGKRPPIAAKHLATALAALDIGLAMQTLIDPEEVPSELHARLYGLLFDALIPEGAPQVY